MGFAGLLMKGAGLGVKGVWGAASRPVLGGAIMGGATGYFGSNSNSDQLRMEEGMAGAVQGAVGGFLLAKAPGMLWRNKGALAGAGWSATKAAAKAGRFAFEHPLLVGGVAAGAMGIAAYNSADAGSPALQGATMHTAVNKQAVAAEELTGGTGIIGTGMVGSGQQMLGQHYRDLAMSTPGLVQGLYRSRHG